MEKGIVKQDESQELVLNPWNKLPIVKKCFAPSLTDDEFMIFVGLGKSLGANPFTREIWAVKYDKQAASIFCGRDFYRRKAQEQPNYNGHIVNAVYENDSFIIENGQPKHMVNSFKDRGKLIGAFCAVYKTEIKVPYFVTVQIGEYMRTKSDGTPMSNWHTMPETMIKKVAEAQALRGAYQGVFKGTYDESEVFNGTIINQEGEEIKDKQNKISEQLATCQDAEMVTEIRTALLEAEAHGTNTLEFYDEILGRFIS